MTFRLIPDVETPEWEELLDKVWLVVEKTWDHADVMSFDDEAGTWYSPVDGSEFYPQPTHYMEIPKFVQEE